MACCEHLPNYMAGLGCDLRVCARVCNIGRFRNHFRRHWPDNLTDAIKELVDRFEGERLELDVLEITETAVRIGAPDDHRNNTIILRGDESGRLRLGPPNHPQYGGDIPHTWLHDFYRGRKSITSICRIAAEGIASDYIEKTFPKYGEFMSRAARDDVAFHKDLAISRMLAEQYAGGELKLRAMVREGIDNLIDPDIMKLAKLLSPLRGIWETYNDLTLSIGTLRPLLGSRRSRNALVYWWHMLRTLDLTSPEDLLTKTEEELELEGAAWGTFCEMPSGFVRARVMETSRRYRPSVLTMLARLLTAAEAPMPSATVLEMFSDFFSDEISEQQWEGCLPIVREICTKSRNERTRPQIPQVQIRDMGCDALHWALNELLVRRPLPEITWEQLARVSGRWTPARIKALRRKQLVIRLGEHCSVGWNSLLPETQLDADDGTWHLAPITSPVEILKYREIGPLEAESLVRSCQEGVARLFAVDDMKGLETVCELKLEDGIWETNDHYAVNVASPLQLRRSLYKYVLTGAIARLYTQEWLNTPLHQRHHTVTEDEDMYEIISQLPEA